MGGREGGAPWGEADRALAGIVFIVAFPGQGAEKLPLSTLADLLICLKVRSPCDEHYFPILRRPRDRCRLPRVDPVRNQHKRRWPLDTLSPRSNHEPVFRA